MVSEAFTVISGFLTSLRMMEREVWLRFYSLEQKV